MKKKIIVLVMLILVLFPSCKNDNSGSELRKYLPLDDLPRKLIVSIETGVEKLYEDNDVKYAIIYMNPAETNLIVYDFKNKKIAKGFFTKLIDEIQGEIEETNFHGLDSYLVKSDNSIVQFWLDGSMVFGVEIIRNNAPSETDKKAAQILSELLYKKAKEKNFSLISFMLTFLVGLLLVLFIRKKYKPHKKRRRKKKK